jgi:hypothetical protein
MSRLKRKKGTYGVLIFLWLFPFHLYTYAYGLHAEILPPEVKPGDLFLIRLTGVKTLKAPLAILKDNTFYFTTCGDGCFNAIGAVGLDMKPGRYAIKVMINGREEILSLTVISKTFPEISLTLPEEKVFLKPEDMRRVEREHKRLDLIWKVVSDRLWEGDFIMPLIGRSQRLWKDLTTAFGTKRIINRRKISVHKGIDIKAKRGEQVRASNRGRVVLAEELFFGGNTIILDHGIGIYTIYMHLSGFNVKPGDIVEKGEIIGFVGSSGRATGPHLHFGVRLSDINVNPVSLLKLRL